MKDKDVEAFLTELGALCNKHGIMIENGNIYSKGDCREDLYVVPHSEAKVGGRKEAYGDEEVVVYLRDGND